MYEEDFLLKPPTDASSAANPVATEPTRGEALRFALTDAPRGESDESKATRADYLGRVYFDMLQKAQRGIDPSKDDDALRAEAVYFSQVLTGQDDVYGKLWKKGGFKTGREYLEKMHDFFLNGGQRNLTPELQEFQAKSYDEQVAEAMEKRGTLDAIVHAVGSGASYSLEWLRRADTDKLAAEKRLQESMYRSRVRNAYAAKLMADNAWHELSAILPTLSADGQACAKALMESKDNRLPEQMWAKFNNLDDQEKELVCRARTCLAARVEGSFANAVGDMAIGAANVAATVAAAPYRFGNKIGMILSNDAFDAGFDVNELAKRRQYLYQATGRFYAGSAEGGYLPQLQFEQMCEEHGFLAESLIGAVSTLPYMAAAAVPGIGVATVAMEAMSQMDDHVAMSGGDITDPDYMFSNALFGAMYAYTERLQVDGLLGGVKDMELRQAMLKGFWSGVKDGKPVRTLAAGTFAESLQEGLQNGIMAANEALALDQDATKAFAEGFTQDFINSLGTMLVVEGGGIGFAHWRRSGFNNPFSAAGREAGREARSVDLETEYEKDMSLDRMVEHAARSEELRGAMDAAEAFRLYRTWESGGKDALIKAGVDPVSAEEWDYFYSSTRNGVIQDEETGEDMPDVRWQKAQQDIQRYLAHEAAKRTKKGEEADLAAFDLAMTNLDWVRSAWSQGAGVYRTDEAGKVQDPGQKALEELGFSKDVAKRLSEYFHRERSAAYSPAALNGIKARYDERMEGKVTAKAALARQFGGQIVRFDGADYMQFTGKDGISLVRIDETPGGIDFAEASEGVAVDVERATEGKVTKQQWLAATPDERRKIWKDYGLVHEGAFTETPKVKVTLPADPSVGIDSAQAATVVGAISLDSQTDNRQIADTSAAFHEVYHAFSTFAQASGLWTKEDAQFLEKTFGKAKHSQETHDEEAAAEGFRSFLARRANGALTVDDEKSPFMKIYAAAAGLDATAKERAAQEKVAGEKEKAFFDQLIAEANKPKPKPPAPKPDLPKTAAPQKGLKPSSAEATEGKPGTEPQKTETESAETGTQTATTETKTAQTETSSTQPGAPRTWSAYTPTGNVKVSGHWAVLDLKDVIHSNNPLYAVHMRAQLRNRKDNKAEEDTRKDIVNNFQGERLLDAPDTANGAPIVFYADDGNGTIRPFVLSGNGRVLVLNELAERHLYDHYRNVMKKWAAANGIEVPNGQTPILVRVIDDYGGASRDKVADLSNTNSIQQYTEEEQARADAEVIKALGLARLYQANADGSADMTPGANDEFFSEFIRGVGDTSLYNSDRSLTQTARDRAQRALLAIAVGQGDRGRSVVKKLVEQTETLGIQRQKNAAAIMAAPVAALESNAAYAIGPDVSRAMADFMDYAEKRKAGKVGTFKDYYDQMDLLDKPSYVARELLNLLGSDKAAATIAEYVKAYCKAAAMEDPAGGLFGAARTKDEIWNDAKKLVDETIAREQRTAPKTQQKTQPTTEAKKPAPKQPALQKGSVSIAPAADAPRQARPPVGTVTYTIKPHKDESITSTMPAGAFGDLRGPYDPYDETPESKNPIRSIFSGRATQQLDPQGRYWGDKMPQFMGHKTEMFDRTVMTLRQKLGPEELAKFDTVVDYFGGGGSWGTSLALATMPNVKRIIINEFDPGRTKKIELLQTLGEDIAKEAEKAFVETGVLKEMFNKLKTAAKDGGESGSGGTMANVIIRNFKDRFAKDPRQLGLMYAVTDCASRQLASSRDVKDAETGEKSKVKVTAAERWEKVMAQLAKDGKNATAMRKAIEARGGKVEYVNGDSTKPDFGVGFDVPHGGNVMAVADPPYYRTEGYSDDGSSWKIGLETTPGAYAYADTGEFLKSLVDNGDGIVYTDEAWWLKPEYMETHRVQSDGLLDDAEILAANPEFRRENEILQGIRDIFDHFDVAGKVAERYETLGVQHGKETKNGTETERRAAERQGSGVLHGGAVGGADDGAGRQGDGRQSIRRLAGGAEGKDDALLRTGGEGRQGSGLRREDAVRQIDAALKDALPPGTAGYPGQASEIESLARHSVRQVREERIRDYAQYMSANAKRWIANAAKRLDERMKAAGYTEKVWHGTEGDDFSVFKFSAGSHDVPAAYFAYSRGTAQNYAALRSMGVDSEMYNVREFYINPGKVLDIDESKRPIPYAKFKKLLAKAYADGYNAVRVKGALDDQGVRLDENDENPEFTKEGDDDLPTDILIVMQQPGDNAPARIKAADPVTFDDEELPIPLEMRADQTMPDVRHSVTMGKNAREEARRMIEKYRPGLHGFVTNVDGVLMPKDDAAIESIAAFPTPKERKAALLWFCKDTIQLPEDSPKVTEAIKTAEKAKVDPMQFERPGDILVKYAKYRPNEPRINPDTVPELSDKRELKNGITTYLVQDDKAGQAAMRRIINTHWGKDANPWCLLQGNGDGILSDGAWSYWQQYSALPKRVAFKDGKLLAFMATDKAVEGRAEAEERYQEAIEEGDYIPDREAWIREKMGAEESWWDRADASHAGIPFERTVPDDSSSGKTTETVELLPDGSERIISHTNKQTMPDGSKVTNTDYLDENSNVTLNTRRTEYADGSAETVKTVGHEEETIWQGPTGGGSLVVVTIRGQIRSFHAQDAHYGSVSLAPYNNIIVWRNAGREEYISKSEPTTVAALVYLESASAAVRKGDPIPPPPTPDTARHSISGIYTGSAADYDKPSLHAVGTGEGSQVYGYGLYGSTVRGVAEGYAEAFQGQYIKTGKSLLRMNMAELVAADRLLRHHGDVELAKTALRLDARYVRSASEALEELEQHANEYHIPKNHLYEQTFFTDRAPGDESHLLNWYEPVPKAQKAKIIKQLNKEHTPKYKGAEDGTKEWTFKNGKLAEVGSEWHYPIKDGQHLYWALDRILGTPQAASEFLARAGIDGVKYPADSFGKGVKDGDEVGWNYVSFRDDNIRVDHKWVDGQQRYSISRAKPMTAVEVARAVEYFGTTEDPKEAAFILQDGRWLDYEQMGEHWEISQAFNKGHMKQLDALQEFDGDAAPYIDAALKAGLVRVTGGVFDAQGNPIEAGLQVGIPLDASLARNMTDYVDAAAERYPTLRTFTVESYAAPGFARQYDMADPRSLAQIKRDINDALVRHSIFSSGRYYGTELRDIAHGLKRGDKDSIDKAADLMALNVPEKAVLVPMPGHEGPATTMLPLAKAIAKRVKGATAVDALVAEPHESNYTHKQRVHRPVKVVMHRTDAKLPKGRPVLVVDNVIASGATYRAAQDAIPGIDLLTLADAGRGRETPGHRERMRHSVFMGEKGAIWSNTGKDRLYVAADMLRAAGKDYTPEVRDEIYAKTGWWKGTDGKWRIEIPDMKPKKLDVLPTGVFRDGTDAHVVPLADLVSNTRLFKAYSELKHLDVWFVDPDSDQLTGLAGWLEDGKIIMSWDALTNLDPEDGEIKLTYEGMQTLTHEVQHYVQWMEDFATGGSQRVNGKRNYVLLAGEVEARNAERRYGGPYGSLVSARQDDATRRWMIENDRAPWQTEDVPTLRQLISHGDGRQTDINGKPIARHSISTTADIEADARRAISASIADGDKKAANDALENYVAYFKLAHGSIPRPQTLARIGLSLGMNVVEPKRILKNAEKLAEQMKGTVIERASQNGDVATAMSLIKREKDVRQKVENLIAGGVELGGKLTHKGVGQINSLLQRRVESMMRDFTAASLADMEGDTGMDLAAEILENNPDAFETEYRRAKKALSQDDKNDGGAEGPATPEIPFDESEMTDSERYKREVLMKEAAERVANFIEEAKRRAEENGARAAEARERRRVVELEGGGADGDGENGGAAPQQDRFDPKPKDVKANFKTPEEFAAFLRVWARDKFARTHGLTTLGRAEQDRLFAEFYRLCARKELQDLADKLLAPKMVNEDGKLVTNYRLAKMGNGARVWVSRRIGDMEKGMRPDTIERASADIFAFINKAAIRVSRVDLITSFKQELKERFLDGAEFEEFKQDTERKLTGWLEESTRYIIRVCDLSRKSVNGDPSQLEQEYRALHDIIDKREKVYDESGRDVADAAKEDAETRKAQWKLALLDKYGAMRSLMPGQILDLQNAAFEYLENEAVKLEEAWKETREDQDRVRREFAGAIVGPNGQRYDEKKHTIGGWISNKFFDSLNGMIRLRLEHLTRFASAEARAKAKDAINSILVKLGDGEVAYARALQGDREAFFAGLGEIFKTADGNPDNKAIKKYLERMDEPIPVELSRQLSNQGYAESMTFGQMLQLLVSLEQRSFKDTIEENGREGQAELIRTFRYRDADGNAVNAFTKEDDAFVDMLRAFYAAKRDQISEVTERMVGQKVDSPDPLYCPIRRWMDDKARDLHADPTQRWDPISKIFSRRVPSTRDFDESRTIVGLFFENSKESAKLVAWAERGSFIRNVVTSVGFQAAVKRAFGPGELSKILKQLEATFNGGEQRSQTPGEVAAADKAVNFVTYAYLGFNPLSALKQTTSFAVWANQLPNGFADLWRYMTHFDAKALKHLMESDEYRVRYGNAVGSGMDYATKGINMNPGQNPVSRALSGAGMWMLKRGDFMPGGWIAQGVYKDLLDKHLKEGMGFDEADRLAITETFNMLEETQQSGRTYNTNMLQIEHGRIGRLLTQFATSPLQQLQYETQAWREWRDMVRYQMGDKKIAEARAKFRRAVVINHVIIPAALNLVIAMYKAALGEEPPWEKDGYHWTLLIDLLLGQFSRVFFLGAFAQSTLAALLKRESPRWGQVLPIEGAIGMAASGAFLVHDLATMDADKLQKDIERAIKSTAPTRLPYNVYRRITGDSDADRKAKKDAQNNK